MCDFHQDKDHRGMGGTEGETQGKDDVRGPFESKIVFPLRSSLFFCTQTTVELSFIVIYTIVISDVHPK